MKRTDLLKKRDKLRMYDELKKWKKRFRDVNMKTEEYYFSISSTVLSRGVNTFNIPTYIREIIVNALEAEIQKLDEE